MECRPPVEPGHKRSRIPADAMPLFRSGNPTAYLHAVSVISGEKPCEKAIRFPPGGNSNDVPNCDSILKDVTSKDAYRIPKGPRHIKTDSVENDGIINVLEIHVKRMRWDAL